MRPRPEAARTFSSKSTSVARSPLLPTTTAHNDNTTIEGSQNKTLMTQQRPLIFSNGHEKVIVCMCDNIRDIRRHQSKRRSKWTSLCPMYRFIVVGMVLSMVAICVTAWTTSLIMEKRIMARLTEQRSTLGRTESAYYPIIQGGQSEIKRRSANRRHRRRHRCRRGSDAGATGKSATHLQIVSGPHFMYTDPETGGQVYFVWSESQRHVSSNLDYERSPNHRRPNDVLGIKARNTGWHEVYSQVVVHGRNSSQLPYNCAQEIVLIRNDRVVKTLLKSYITQHGLGMAISGTLTEDGNRWPMDSVNQYGVFYLSRGDEVRVTFDGDCNNHLRFNNREPSAFFFGIAQK